MRWVLLTVALVILISAGPFPVGASREVIEQYLNKNRVPFTSMCCIGAPGEQSWADLVEIGREEHPWYCSQSSVYLAFRFNGSVLRQTSLYRQLAGCL